MSLKFQVPGELFGPGGGISTGWQTGGEGDNGNLQLFHLNSCRTTSVSIMAVFAALLWQVTNTTP